MFKIFAALVLSCVFVKTSYGAIAQEKIAISSKGDQLVFDKTNLSAKVNQQINLTFKNAASKSSGLQHNWALVKPGTAEQVATASLSAGESKGWLADSPDILAHTKLLNAGESETITFNSPSTPGEYPYFCSFPGHAATMKGILKVTK